MRFLTWLFLSLLIPAFGSMAFGQTPSATTCGNPQQTSYVYNNHFYICTTGVPFQVDGGGLPSGTGIVAVNSGTGALATGAQVASAIGGQAITPSKVTATSTYVAPSTINTFTNIGYGFSDNSEGISGDLGYLQFYVSSGILAATVNGYGWAMNVQVTAPTYFTASNCSSSSSPAVCGSAASGSFVIAASATTVTVNTSAVTANSQIQITPDESLGTKLGVTCNTTAATALATYGVTARTAGTSFTVTTTATIATNPVCYSYTIFN